MVLKASAIWAHRMMWWAAAVVLLLVALYVSAGRYYIGFIEQYQRQLLQRIEQLSGLPVTADRIYGRWSQLSPMLSFEQVVLPGRRDQVPVLQIPEAHLQFNPLLSIIRGELRIDRLQGEGMRLSLREYQPGQWRLSGYNFEGSEARADLDRLLDQVLMIDVFAFNDSVLTLQYHNGATARLNVPTLTLHRSGDFRRLKLEAFFKQGDPPLSLLIESYGDPRDRGDFHAKGHVNFDRIDFIDQLPILASLGVPLQEAKLDSELWLDWRPGRAITVQGHIRTPLLDVGAISGRDIAPLTDLQVAFRFEKSRATDWQLWLPEVSGRWGDHDIVLQELFFQRRGSERSLSLPRLDLAPLASDLLALNVLPEKAVEALTTLQPSGALRHVFVRLPYTMVDNRLQFDDVFRLEAQLEHVAVGAWHGAPAAAGVNGYIVATADGGEVVLDTDHFEVFFNTIYSEPMSFASGQGVVAWSLLPDRVRVESGLLRLTADHGPASGRFSLELPKPETMQPHRMFLSVGLRDTDAGFRNKFIPFVVDSGLRSWLDSSIEAGHISQAAFIYNGPISAHADYLPTVQLALDVDQASLRFSEDWPAATAISASVYVDDQQVISEGAQGQMLGLAINNLTVRSVPMGAAAPRDHGSWLTIDGDVQGNTADGLAVVQNSVLRELVGDSFVHWRVAGDIGATLSLGVPLGNGELKPVIDFRSQLIDTQLHIDDLRLAFTELNGPLNYHSERGLYASGLEGQFFGHPQKVTISQSEQTGVEVAVNGKVDMRDVERWTEQPALTFMQGVTPVSVRLTLDGANSVLNLHSELKGVTIDLPAPFGKSKQQASQLVATLPLGQDSPRLNITYSDTLELSMQMQQRRFTSGSLQLGGFGKPQFNVGQFTVHGAAPELDYAEFERLFAAYLAAAKRYASDHTPQGEVEADSMALVIEDLLLVQAKAAGFVFDNTLLSLRSNPQGWLLEADNDRVTGSLLLPHADDGVPQLRLERLALSTQQGEQGASSIDPRALVDIDVQLDRLLVDEKEWGYLEFSMRSSELALQLLNINGQLFDLTIGSKAQPASLVWLRGDYGDTTSVAGTLHFADLNTVLSQFGADSIVVTEQGAVDVAMSWPASPVAWSLEQSTGRFTVAMEKGRFLKTSEAAEGGMKLVSVFNLANLLRRLRFDFTDVYRSGISFDSINGRFTMGEGRMTIVDELDIRSPSSSFRLYGSTDLLSQQLNMGLVATLPVANNLPWIAALAGGLPAAAGAYVASKVFEDQFASMSSAVYTLEGSWSEPKLEFNRVFSDKPDSKPAKQRRFQDSSSSRK